MPRLKDKAKHLSVAESIDLAATYGAERMDFVLVNRKGLALGPLTDWMVSIQRLFGNDDQSLQRFTARGSDDQDGPRETIDLLADRLCDERRSEEHTSELQSQFRISYAVFCL